VNNQYHREGTLLWNHVVVGPRNGYDASKWGGVISFEGGALEETNSDAVALYRPMHQYGRDTPDIPQGFNNFDIVEAEANGRAHFVGNDLRPNQWDPVNNVLSNIIKLQKLTNEYGNTAYEFQKLTAFEFGLEDENDKANNPYIMGLASCASDSPDWGDGTWQSVVAPHIIRGWDMGDFYIRNAYCDSGQYATDVTIRDGKPSNPDMQRIFKEIHYFIDTYGKCGPIVIGEFGYVAFPTGHADNNKWYVDNMLAFDEYVRNNGYKGIAYADVILGITCFTAGDWNEANNQSANPLLNSWLADNPYRKWDPKIYYTDDAQPPEVPDGSYEQQVYANAMANAFPINADAALEKKMITDGYSPAGAESWDRIEGIHTAYQPAYEQNAVHNKRAYYATVGKWDDVKWTQGEVEETPTGFRFTNWPTRHEYITQRFMANPQNYERFGLPGHEGVDIRAPHADPIYAVASGVVSQVITDAMKSNYGRGVRVNHGDGYETTYAHMYEVQVVLGQQVSGGEQIGLADDTGNSYGSHLHITLKRKGYEWTDKCGRVWPYNIMDPEPYLMAISNISWPTPVMCPVPPHPPEGEKIAVLDYFRGNDGQQFDKEYLFTNGTSGTQTTMIKHLSATEWLYVKGTQGEYERFWVAPFNGEDWIYRADDTSESPERMYAHYISDGGSIGAPWVPVAMEINKSYQTNKFVQHYLKSGCVKQNNGNVVDAIKLLGKPYMRTYQSGKTVNVITLEWSNGEQYDFAGGNIAFRDATRDFWFMGWLEGRAPLEYKKYDCFGW